MSEETPPIEASLPAIPTKDGEPYNVDIWLNRILSFSEAKSLYLNSCGTTRWKITAHRGSDKEMEQFYGKCNGCSKCTVRYRIRINREMKMTNIVVHGMHGETKEQKRTFQVKELRDAVISLAEKNFNPKDIYHILKNNGIMISKRWEVSKAQVSQIVYGSRRKMKALQQSDPIGFEIQHNRLCSIANDILQQIGMDVGQTDAFPSDSTSCDYQQQTPVGGVLPSDSVIGMPSFHLMAGEFPPSSAAVTSMPPIFPQSAPSVPSTQITTGTKHKRKSADQSMKLTPPPVPPSLIPVEPFPGVLPVMV